MGCTPTKLSPTFSFSKRPSLLFPPNRCHSYKIAIDKKDLFKDFKKAACAGNTKLGLEILRRDASVLNKADVSDATHFSTATIGLRLRD